MVDEDLTSLLLNSKHFEIKVILILFNPGTHENWVSLSDLEKMALVSVQETNRENEAKLDFLPAQLKDGKF